ncbi:MAG: (Fe-S)-binding protein [Bacteroidales bacterium]|nr:(Fe-S)-binding protein [Bacteroidales bacterium]MDD3665897.1 (Fe-S)-binding protein [Bacteroidales bacterium]
MVVDVFIPCFIDQMYPQTGINMVKILQKAKLKVNYNPNQTCCGQMAFNSGFMDEAKAIGEKFIKDFPNDRPVVGPSASCVGYVRNYYQQLFHNTALHNEYKQLKRNIYEFTDFMVNVAKVLDVGAEFPHKVTFHDSCAATREYGLTDQPRLLLSKVKGLQLIEMEERSVCCGFGGTFSVKHEAISVAMAKHKVENALATGAEYIVSTDASCLMHQQAYISKNNIPLKTIHLIDVLASGWE